MTRRPVHVYPGDTWQFTLGPCKGDKSGVIAVNARDCETGENYVAAIFHTDQPIEFEMTCPPPKPRKILPW